MSQTTYLTACGRCNGTGRFDRGACFGCKPYGSLGWVRRSRRPSGSFSQVTAVRTESEGRINWVRIYNAQPSRAAEIVRRQMRVAGTPSEIIESVEAE